VKPILFQIGGFSLHTFGLFVGMGFIAGIWIAARCGRRSGIAADAIQDLVIPWILLGGLVGARIAYVVSYWDRSFAGRPFAEVFQIWNGGLVFYGGLAGAVLVALWRIHVRKLPLWPMADCLAPGIALGHVFGRLGCFFNGCCFGRPTPLPWAVHFPKGTIPDDPWVHPSQLYEAGLNLILCGALVLLHRRRRFDGQVFATYLIGYAIVRTITEWFRGDYGFLSNPLAGAFTPGTSASVVTFIAGIALTWVLSRRRTSRT
jgi:phosphatidylglycerol:prolipoprotein diacylglycerol transferase